MAQLCAANAPYRQQCGKQGEPVSACSPRDVNITTRDNLAERSHDYSPYDSAACAAPDRTSRVRTEVIVLRIMGNSATAGRYTDVASMRLPAVADRGDHKVVSQPSAAMT